MNDNAGRFLDVATLLTLGAALVYVAGWTYAYHYFDHFQLGLLTLEIPAEYYFMYGFWVFRDWWWLVLAVLLGAFYFPLLATRLPAAVLHWGRPALPGLALVVFVAVHWLAVYEANGDFYRQRDADFPDYPRARVWLKPADKQDEARLAALRAALPEGCHRLLLQNQDKLFLFQPPAQAAAVELAAVQVPLSEVQGLRVLPQFGSCGR